MARKDEWGVVIPEPPLGNGASERIGDTHCGEAVMDAYELSRCWIDLSERSLSWPNPVELPPFLAEIVKGVPVDNHPDWLRREAILDEVERCISYAIRSGELPIWVAPHGEPEQLVAIGALESIDRQSIICGLFFPIAEKYKSISEDKRPWLWERPLFVKKDDWVSFAEAMDEERGMTIAPS